MLNISGGYYCAYYFFVPDIFFMMAFMSISKDNSY
jgi:hypothetical protein